MVIVRDILTHMTKPQKIALFLLRITLGFLFLYGGIVKIIDPVWTSAGYLKVARTLPGFYQWLAAPQNIVWVDFLNRWGMFLIGVALILGFVARTASAFAMLLMALYYIPILDFPHVGLHYYIVDEHVIFIVALFVLIVFHSGSYWGIDGMIERSKKVPAAWKKCLLCNKREV